MPSKTDALLTVRNIKRSFGGVKAVKDVSFDVRRGEITGLIGPNGAGKSTVVNIISGFHRSDAGEIRLEGEDVTNWPSYKVARQGLIRTFQVARELQMLTVLENLMLAPQGQTGETALQALFSRRKMRQGEAEQLEKAEELLYKFNLHPLRDEYAGNLSGGQKKLLELARALMANPKLVLLDEPMAGVNPSLTLSLQGHIESLREEGVTFLLIEHNLSVVEALCDHIVAMAEGQVIAEGDMGALRDNKEVVSAYLGG